IQALMEAIKLAQAGNVIRPFLEAYKHAPLLFDQLDRSEFTGVLDHVNRNGGQTQVDAGTESEDPDLTKREKEILNLIETGLSNREMAEKLVIAEGTLKRHVANLYQKLGVHNRAQAIKQFYRL
ncbi:MAG TPA: helix-turn-helix transcriptional regulator, partial [Anaerolineales bacterium]|nr:helix-turn-helix transcriptional regulator [Anaerolineales bacterium]